MSILTSGRHVTADSGTRELTQLFGSAVERLPSRTRHRWTRRYSHWLITLDFVLSLIAATVALTTRFGLNLSGGDLLRYGIASLAFPFLFVAAAATTRAYEPRFIGSGTEEFRRVFDAALRLGALAAIVCVASRFDPARGYLVVSFPLAAALALLGRYGARQVLVRMRARGRCSDKVIVVGRERSVAELIRTVHADPSLGFRVVGACLDTPQPRDRERVEGVPVFGRETDVVAAIAATDADTVAITAFSAFDDQAVRRLGWQLEGTDVSMLLAPRITDVAGPRIHVRPVGRLPLLHVEEPELSGGRRLVKGLLDRGTAAAGLLVLSPLLLAIGVAVRLTSKGPAIFKQERVGTAGTTFTLWKFRTMRVDAEEMLEALLNENKHAADGPLFKIDKDPRITPLGAHLRRFSLDELPQLVQVLLGRMSLVGPRPPLPREVKLYESSVHRRLLVKPGLTGLWQISGRADLSWEDSVRLDLEYVENWSLALDLGILWKTAAAVLLSKGAY